MKKMLILLLAWFLLGQMPMEKWNEIADADLFITQVAEIFSVQNQCNSQVVAMTDGENAYIFARCIKEKINL